MHRYVEIYVNILITSRTLHTRGKELMLLPLIWHTMHDPQHFSDLKALNSNVVSSLDRIEETSGVANLLAACLMHLRKCKRIYGVLGVPVRILRVDALHLKPRGIVTSARYHRARTILRLRCKSASTTSYNTLISRSPFTALPPTASDLGVQKMIMFPPALEGTTRLKRGRQSFELAISEIFPQLMDPNEIVQRIIHKLPKLQLLHRSALTSVACIALKKPAKVYKSRTYPHTYLLAADSARLPVPPPRVAGTRGCG